MRPQEYLKKIIYYLPEMATALSFQTLVLYQLYGLSDWQRTWYDVYFQVFVVAAAAAVCLFLICLVHQPLCAVLLFMMIVFCGWFVIQMLGSVQISCYTVLAVAAVIPVFCPGLWSFICLPAVLCLLLSAFHLHYIQSGLVGGLTAISAAVLCACCAVITGIGTFIMSLGRHVTELHREVDRMAVVIDNITKTNLEYQNYVSTVEQSAVEKERQRISRELHDIIGYTMINTLMLIQAAQTSSDGQVVARLLDTAQKHLSESVDEARMSLRTLRDERLDVLHGRALFTKLVNAFSEITGLRVTVDYANLPEHLALEMEQAIFRIIEESMTNTFKHGNASAITINFLFADDMISLRIFDNGTSRISPGTEIKEGIGLKGMRERLEPLHGSLTASFVQDGFLIQAVIPEAAEDEQV